MLDQFVTRDRSPIGVERNPGTRRHLLTALLLGLILSLGLATSALAASPIGADTTLSPQATTAPIGLQSTETIQTSWYCDPPQTVLCQLHYNPDGIDPSNYAAKYNPIFVMNPVNVYLIFWLPTDAHFEDAAAGAAGDTNYESLIEQYFTDISGSEMYNILTQYYDQQYQNGQVVSTTYHPNTLTVAGTYVDTQPYPQSPLVNSDIESEVTSAIQQNGWATDQNHNIYFVYTGHNVRECLPAPAGCSGDTTPGGFCGWHSTNYDTSSPAYLSSYAYIPDFTICSSGSPSPNNIYADTAISTMSHELFETASDPWGESWFAPTPANGDKEMADLCQVYGTLDASGANLTLNGHSYQVQLEYSNAAGGCTNAFDGQFINFGALGDRTFGDAPLSLSADANVTSGLPISFTASGPCTVSGAQVTLTGAGTCNITANQDGNKSSGGFYDAATSVTQSFSIAQGIPAFTFDLSALGAKTYDDGPFSLASYASKPGDDTGAITFATGSGSVGCTVTADGTVAITGVATGADQCIIEASLAADTNYLAAGPISQSFNIAQATTTVTVTCPSPDPIYTGSQITGCTATATGAGGLNQSLTVTYVGRNGTSYAASTTPPTNAGDYTASASFSGDANHGASSNSVNFSINLPDSTPPTTTIAPSPASPDGSNGWYVHHPTVTVSAVDNTGGSGVAQTRCVVDPSSVPSSFDALPATPCLYLGAGAAVDDGVHTIYVASIDNAGNTENPIQNMNFKVDTAPPTVSYSGNQGTYTVDQTVNISCTAADSLSGIDTATCQDISAPAYSFAVGANTLSSTATDFAGNVASGSVTFTIIVTPDSLISLTQQFDSSRFEAPLLSSPLYYVKWAEAVHNERLKHLFIRAYQLLINTQRGRTLTNQQADTLIRLSNGL